MDVSSITFLQTPHALFELPSLRRHSASPIHFRRNPFGNSKYYPIPFLKIRSCRRPFAVSARFGRPLRRRNTLREKLSIPGADTQVRKEPESSVLDPKLRLPTSQEPNSGTKTGLWDKLDNWVDQYKADSEFWGIGSGPIFTICQDMIGNVVRVSVDEDEVVKRSRIRAWPQEEEAEEYKELNSKISHAKMIAREIEAGAISVPRNSSIAKFVVEGKKPSFMEGVHSVPFQKDEFVKLFPRIGFTVLCVCCVFWGMGRLRSGHDRPVLTREEAEMLRRKKKARMEREQLERGSVNVIDGRPELSVISNRRPPMDRDGLLDSISKAQSERLLITDPSSCFSDKNHDFIDKVTEIREMARQARESEQQDRAENNEIEKNDGGPSVRLVPNGKSVAHKSDASAETETSNNGSDIYDLAETESLSHHAVDEKDMQGVVENSLNGVKGTPHKELRNMNTGNVNVAVDDPEIGGGKPMKIEPDSSAHSSDPSTSIVHNLKNNKKQNGTMINRSGEKEANSSSSCNTSKVSVGRQPKIIRSVKDARKYLAEKQRLSPNEAQSILEVQRKQLQIDNTDCISDDKLDDNMTQTFNLGTKTIDTSKINKLQKDDARRDGSPVENEDAQIQRLQSSYLSSDMPHSSNSVRVLPGLVKPFNVNGSHCTQEFDFPPSNGHSDQESPVKISKDDISKDRNIEMKNKMTEYPEIVKLDVASLTINSSEVSGTDVSSFPLFPEKTSISIDPNHSKLESALDNTPDRRDFKTLSSSETSFQKDSDDGDYHADTLTVNTENWVEKNFQQFDPIIKKIGSGFKENYIVAKEKVQEQPSFRPEISELGLLEDDGEHEWMNNETLRKVVFQVRENELAGRDPFHLMNDDDQRAFFEGLERKADKVNEKLRGLHEWVHSRVENLDYGADGISLYDPIEKIVPRWKEPAIDRNPVLHQEFTGPQTNSDGSSHALSGDARSSLQKPEELLNSGAVSPYSPHKSVRKMSSDKPSRNNKTMIECSDGSSRPGKQKGKEHWQHTKKWSQGFLDVYNAETDPEIKSIMKDMGKDLDRWITEKEIQDVADLLGKIPNRKRRYIEKKMKKLKQEMEMFGAPSVVSKYKEYLDEKEEDYLWWLDLRFVLCIELYTVEDGNPKVGLYSLEMAADLELNPKQYHVIAFEDPGDSKNFCYIIQAHMDMLGTGKAFVVARPPKDAFREAKANGFNVTVIRKGEMKLNVDLMLEEVEEEITEIGSKIYHDTVMRERSVDMNSLMKGMISADRSSKRTTKQSTVKPAKS